MKPTIAMKHAVETAVHHFIDMANEKYNMSMPYPTTMFKVRGTCGGKAHLHEWAVNFNEGLLVDNLSEYLNQTVPHEVAHLVDYKKNGLQYKHTRRGRQLIAHGPSFYRIMRDFGVKEKRTHSMDVSKVRTKRRTTKYIYACVCGKEVELGAIRHKKTGIDGVAPYRHKCHTIGKLTFTGKAVKS